MGRLRISLITPSFNHAAFIERTIESVLTQAGEFDLEYTVLDGGSRDGTLEILQRYDGRLNWRSAPDNGQVDAINTGLRAATGDVVGWLNSDDVLKPGALAAVTEAFTRNPDCEWLHGDCDIIDAHDREIRRWISAYKRWHSRRYSYASLLQRNFICQMTVFWRRSLLAEVGYLDDGLKLAFDYEYWLRLARRTPPLYLPQKLASFRWYETSKSGANFRRQFAEDELIAQRHGLPGGRRRWMKRMNNLLTIGAYRLMAAGRALTRRSSAQ